MVRGDLRKRRVQYYLYTALGKLADFIQDNLGLFRNPRPNHMPSEAVQWSEGLCLHKCQHATELEDAMTWYGGPGSVYVIDDATILKTVGGDFDTQPGQQREVLNMRFVLEHTTIPTPNIYAIIPFPDVKHDAYLIMDYVHGQRLDRAWPRLSIWAKLRVAWILRSYIRQLRRIRHPRSSIPGPLGSGPRRFPEGTLDSLRDLGPFSDAAELTAFLNVRSRRMHGAEIPRKYEEFERLVFTHADLNMRNIIIDDEGRVWLIDWDWSGFYPQSWEFTSMATQAETHPQGSAPLSWRRCVPFIADPYFDRYRWRFGRSS